MYDFLFDQTYINLFVLALLLFLVMFLWRKVTIIEGNYFLLEKRVNIIKKEGRENLLTKNIERSEVVMNEIFRDSVTSKSCNNLNSECKIPNSIATQNEYNHDDMKRYVQDISEDCETRETREAGECGKAGESCQSGYSGSDAGVLDISINYFNVRDNNPKNKIELIDDDPSVVIETIQYIDPIENALHEEAIVTPIELTNSVDICDITDTGSVCSDITFNNEDKAISKKYKNMNIEKLRDECKEKSLNTEGNKAALISRLVDSSKKQK
jgi:hypothetical protein